MVYQLKMLHFKIKKSALCLKTGQAMAGLAGPLATALLATASVEML